MAEHAWCRDVPRDEAVRAAEDGRSGPLPTLEEAISRAGQFALPEPSRGEKCTERDNVTERRPLKPRGGGNVTGMRTERITLEITHDLDAPLGDWIVQVIDESLGYGETVRVVEAKLAPAANADGKSNHAAPDASGAAGTGWLTEEERLAVSGAILILDQHGPTNIGHSLNALLARSTPPEVVLEDFPPYAVRYLDTKYLAGWQQCMALAKRAILAAGVTVKEVG